MAGGFLSSITAICGVVLLAVCVYYERARAVRKLVRKQRKIHGGNEGETRCEPRVEEEIVREINQGESLMASSNIEAAVEHFARAISLCASPEDVINSLEESLPPFAYNMLLSTLINCYKPRFDDLQDELKQRCNGFLPNFNLLDLKFTV